MEKFSTILVCQHEFLAVENQLDKQFEKEKKQLQDLASANIDIMSRVQQCLLDVHSEKQGVKKGSKSSQRQSQLQSHNKSFLKNNNLVTEQDSQENQSKSKLPPNENLY
mmetsp:Transcript_681/g.736  ORF Transcript_681/g.736 Transcript_681/m.736 type:complete len:109 (+) Transcript_681:2049-2375(+)